MIIDKTDRVIIQYTIDTYYALTYKIKHSIRKVVAAYERARYGWSKTDILCGGFDTTLMPAIGHSLQYLSKNLHGAPAGYGNGDDTNYSQWEEDLFNYGQDLINGSDGIYVDDETHRKTKEALIWISYNYDSLWD